MATSCGGKAVVDGRASEGGAGSGGGTTSTTTSTGGTTSTATTSTGSPDLRVSLDELEVGIGCMPEIPPDPVYARFVVSYDNSAGSAAIEATLLDPSITFRSGAMALAWHYAVDPPGSGLVPAGEVVTVTHQKVPGSGSGDGNGTPCEYCGAEGAFFEVDVDAGPWSVSLGEEIGSVGCAF